jgi:glycosyltransferase involved in cell wall biosynthesis
MKKKKILLLSDDLRVHSGIGTMSREIVLNTVKEFDWVQLAAAIQHPETGKMFDLSAEIAKVTGVEDANVKLIPFDGYGNQDVVRELIAVERPDAILHFTDPRFWGWLYQMEHEIRQEIPLFYYTIWDDSPAPRWNRPFYESCDLLMCISKQTKALVTDVLKDSNYQPWQITYVPHGIPHDIFFPLNEQHEQWNEFQEFKKKMLGEKEYDFIMFYNARNIRRKHTPDLMLGFEEFVSSLPKEKQDKCLMLLHTEPVDENGTDLVAVAEECCKTSKVQFTNIKPISTKELNFLYNMSDITANIASNEGFGLGTAESVMAGTPIIVNVTGGMQDQCGFKNESGEYLTEDDYTPEWPTNAIGTYTEHGEWVKPIWPKTRTLQGSPMTPYIFDDIADYHEAANAIKYWYEKTDSERTDAGQKGRDWMLSVQTGMSAKEMGNRFIKDMNNAFDNWTPRSRYELVTLK